LWRVSGTTVKVLVAAVVEAFVNAKLDRTDISTALFVRQIDVAPFQEFVEQVIDQGLIGFQFFIGS
jgi:hypothetical protein